MSLIDMLPVAILLLAMFVILVPIHTSTGRKILRRIAMGLFVVALVLIFTTSQKAHGAEKVAVQQAGNYLIKRSNGTVVVAPGFVGTVQYFSQYNDAVSLAATTSRDCNGCDIWIVQPSLKVNMTSDAPVATTLRGTTTPGNVAFTWSAPTTRMDGTALATNQISKYIVTITQGTTVIKTVETNNTTLTTTVPLISGQYQATVVVVDSTNTSSLPSNQVVFQL